MEAVHIRSGSTVTYTTGMAMSSFTLTSTFSGSEVERLRAILVSLRPKDGVHDYLCDSNPDGPDQWVDESNDTPIRAEGWRKSKWEPGVGLVDDGPAPTPEPYVGWCCNAARQRQEIDAALKT